MCFACRKRVTHFRFVYYVVGHCKMILLQILGPFLPFVEFLEIFCPSSKFWKSVAFRSGFGEPSPFIHQQGFGILLQLRMEVRFNSFVRKEGTINANGQLDGCACLSQFFSVSPLIFIQAIINIFVSIIVFVFIFSFVFAFLLLFVLVFVFVSVFVFGSSLMCISPHSHSHSHPSLFVLAETEAFVFWEDFKKYLR